MDEALKDERFKHILSDPRFRKMPKRIQKVALDKRMKKIFKDSSFKGKCELDKRGRPLNLTPTENLKRLYDMPSESSDDNSDEDEEQEEQKNEGINEDEAMHNTNLKPRKESASNELLKKAKQFEKKDKNKEIPPDETISYKNEDPDESDGSESEDNMDDQVNAALKTKKDAKNGLPEEDSEESSSEESDESDSDSDASEGDQNEDFDHKWEELRNEAPDTNEITRRLAVCNMDWDRIRAIDLLVCFNSFKPADGNINSVKIYPSEYGLKRMEEEKLKGPPELVERTLALDEEEVEDKKGSKYHREKLRQYQISRLKYFYAVVDCDSTETANVLYEQLNGMEYESSSVRFDLRFIPDDVTFDQEPTSVAEKPPDPSEYKPRLFVTSALQQVKVDLTWDETDPKRRDFFHKIFTDPDSVQNDIQDYLASASSESEVEENLEDDDEEPGKNMKTKDRIAKYRELLLSLEEKEKKDEEKYDIEVTWEPDAKEKVEEQVREKIQKETLNPFEEMLQKKKKDKKLKKKELKAINKKDEDSLSDSSEEELDSNESNTKAKNDKKLAELALISDSKKEMDVDEKPKKKNKKDKSRDLDDFVGDPNDPRFAAMYKSSLFNMVPSNSHEKKTDVRHTGKSQKRKFKQKFNESHKRSKF